MVNKGKDGDVVQWCLAIISLKLGFFSVPVKIAISNNRTKWSPIWSVIIRVIKEMGQPCSGSPICLITSMITDRIERLEFLVPINHNLNKICDI